MAVQDWNTNEALNVVLEGENVAEGSLPPGLNNMARKFAAALKVMYNSCYGSGVNGGKQRITIQASGGAAPAAPNDGDIWMEYTP